VGECPRALDPNRDGVTLPNPEAESEEGDEELDYRFTLANERTFLAWMRTALGLLAGGVAVHTLVQSFRIAGLRRAIALSCLVLAAVVAVGAYAHWRRIGVAMRRGDPLPETVLVPILSAGIAIVSVLAGVAVLLR
jgi:putative membrane protein